MGTTSEGDAGTNRDSRASRGARWTGWASIALSHVVACVVATTCLLTLPLVLFTLLFVGALIFAAATNGDPGGPLFYPLGALAIFVVGASCSLAVCVFGLATDLLRRLLSWPVWIAPIAAFVFAFVVSLVILFAKKVGLANGTAGAAVIALASVAVFATYWIPLSISDIALRLVRRLVSTLFQRIRAHRAASRSNSVAPSRA